jgi:arylsulfatase A-like enzyme
MTVASAVAAPPQPDVLVIYCDQFRYDCYGAAGNPDVKTPHLDALAAEGVRFTNSFCTWPVCTPSRYSLLSGMYVRQHGGFTNRATLHPTIDTYPRDLHRRGYDTMAIGKMHFTPPYLDVGFSRLLLSEQNGRGRLVDDYHRYLRDLGRVDAIDIIDQEREYRKDASADYWSTFGAQVSDLPEALHSTTWIGDRAVEAVGAWTDKPQLLMMGFIKPHHPFDPPDPWHKMYDPDKLTILPGWLDEPLAHDIALRRGYFDNRTLTEPALRRVMAYYYATISHMDAQIGRVIERLKETRRYDNTLIVFTADHGEYLGFHHLLLKNNYMYDPLIKVPLIVKFPGGRLGGTASDALVNSVDVTTTIVERTGGKPATTMMGQNLYPIAAGTRPGRKIIFAESSRAIMARTHTAKLLYHHDDAQSLFLDLKSDPLEMNNRYRDPAYVERIAELESAMARWSLFETRRPVHLDASEREIDQPNVPADRGVLEKEMLRFIADKLRR